MWRLLDLKRALQLDSSVVEQALILVAHSVKLLSKSGGGA
jgi:hypothetical protein